MNQRNQSNSDSSGRRRPNRKKSDRKKQQQRRLMMEGLESRQLMAVLTEPPIQPAPTDLPVFTVPRNVGTVAAFTVSEVEPADEMGQNDFRAGAQVLPFGTGAGQQDTIDLSGTLPINTSSGNTSGFSADIDIYALDLKAGDIIDIATAGAAGEFVIQGPFAQNINPINGLPEGAFLPSSTGPNLAVSFRAQQNVGAAFTSPRQTEGNVTGVAVIPQDGRYFLTIAASAQTTTYTVGLRAYRPVTESLAFGDAQILYLDWEGGVIDNNIFLSGTGGADNALPTFGITVIPTLEESLEALGLEFLDAGSANRIATETYQDVIRIFEDLAISGGNGDFGASGIGGDYAVRILNSREPAHRQWYETNTNDPRITRMIIGGTGLDIGIPGVFGIAEAVDVGNFDLTELGLFALDGFQGDTLGSPISPAVSPLDATIQFLSSVVAHEAGHTFGMLHTVNTNNIESLSDAGGGNAVAQGLGVGPDGIFGTIDDVEPIFRDDFFADELFSGFNRVTTTLAYGLSSGTLGGVGSTGQVFRDVNGNGVDNNDPGLAGVTVFADIDGDTMLGPGEPQAVSAADGTFSLTLPAGSFTIRAITPTDFQPTTAIAISSAGNPSFGFRQVVANVTGTTYVDSDGDGIRDPGEDGLADVFVYLDLDEDNRPDLGEPNARSAANGTYSLNFPGPGTYTIRQVLPVGFEQTSPVNPPGEHTVVFDGTALSDNYDFGLLPSRDFGDAPESYGTLINAGGASHGILAGLFIGGRPDREVDGQPSADATGDDSNGGDDEDGVTLTSPLGPGGTATFEVVVTNTTTSPAFLQAFMDFNADGDFTDAGEQYAINQPVPAGTSNQTLSVPVNVPANAVVGNTFTRFRLSQQSDLGVNGFATSGEVEDHAVTILASAEVANDDAFSVSRNSLSNRLDLLANDFDNAGSVLTIISTSAVGLQGVVVIANGGTAIDYTPPNGFIGVDRFQYIVSDQFGNRSTADVAVTVTFQSNVPIAVDDSFQVPQGSVNRALNVLDNDVPSTSGGLTITSVTPGSSGANIQIIGGGQSLRYTPQPGFNGTEQFTYSVQDSAGQVSTAQVTVNLLPGSVNDDVVDFTVGIFDTVNNRPITNVTVGQDFLVRVSVEDLDPLDERIPSVDILETNPEGVASAFLDLLYTDELVSTLASSANPSFPFDITFGPLFSGSENFLQRASATTPGLIDEVGGVQPITNQQAHDGPVELFTIRMQAIAPGVAQFISDPSDEAVSETVVLNSDVALTVNELGLGRTELVIFPASDNFTSAIDDSFPEGVDSQGNPIVAQQLTPNRLDVLGNDNLGPTGSIREFGLVTNPTFGTVLIDNNGTIDNLNDDFLSYRANANANGLERFTYVIVTEDNVRSTAEVTIPLGNTNSDALVAIDFALVSEAGSPISSVSVGQTFGVQVNVEDLRNPGSTFVFAGFLDVLYSSNVIRPVAGGLGSEFNFDVEFGDGYVADAGVGTAARRGIIDEFGTLSSANEVSDESNPATLATLFFEAIASGTASVVGSPADSSPFQDTLLFGKDDPVDVSEIRYDQLTINVGSGPVGGGEGEALQNPTLAQDVNNDGAVSPIDALLIINAMGRTPSAEGEQAGLTSSQFYTDVNGDKKTSAIDALQVINYLSRANSQSSEGEAVVAPIKTGPSNLASSAGSTDAVFSGLIAETDHEDKLVDSGSANQSSSSTATIVSGSSASASDSDDDDVLNLLADDVQGLLGSSEWTAQD